MWDKETADASSVRCIPGLILFQNTCMQHQHTDEKTLEFTIELAANTHTNYSSMCIVLPIQIKKSTDKTANVNVITVNNFFCHWLKEIDARRYPDDVRILPTNNTVEIYQYVAQQLKHLPSKSLDDIRETLLYQKKLLF